MDLKINKVIGSKSNENTDNAGSVGSTAFTELNKTGSELQVLSHEVGNAIETRHKKTLGAFEEKGAEAIDVTKDSVNSALAKIPISDNRRINSR